METTLKAWSPNGPTSFDSGRNYIGADLREHFTVLSRTRDSGELEESNFAYALRELGGETGEEDDGTHEGSGVYVARFNHWACGWYETIMIDPAAPEAEKAIRTAEEILARLEDYPVLDEDDLSTREFEAFGKAVDSGCFDDELEACLADLVGREISIGDLRPANQERIRGCASMADVESIDERETEERMREVLKLTHGARVNGRYPGI